MSDKRIEALTKAAEKKKQDALEKTEKAIKELIKKKHRITIRSVAREAGVSVSYLYKYPELSHRIQQLREQQKSYPVKPQSPSSKSHQIITTQLRNRIKILEQEKEELRKQITILASNISEMSKSENSIDRLKAENIKLLEENGNLRKRLQYLEQQLNESRDFILRQGYKNKSNNTAIKKDNLDIEIREKKVRPLLLEEKTVVPTILPGQSLTESIQIDDEIQKSLSQLGIRLSKTLIKEIKDRSKEQVINAISVVRENIDTGVKIRSKVGLFRSALKEDWIPNEYPEERTVKQYQEDFSQWYDLPIS